MAADHYTVTMDSREWVAMMMEESQTFLLPSGLFLSEIPGLMSFEWWEVGATAHESKDSLQALLRCYFHRHFTTAEGSEE